MPAVEDLLDMAARLGRERAAVEQRAQQQYRDAMAAKQYRTPPPFFWPIDDEAEDAWKALFPEPQGWTDAFVTAHEAERKRLASSA